MNRRSRLARTIALAAVLLSGCATNVGTSSGHYVPPTAAGTCQAQCQAIGLELAAVVVMADNVGCVCQPKGATAARASSTAVAGGMAAILQQDEQSRRNSQQSVH
jgi:hypothetical protein